jgi:hypothetical protein
MVQAIDRGALTPAKPTGLSDEDLDNVAGGIIADLRVKGHVANVKRQMLRCPFLHL